MLMVSGDFPGLEVRRFAAGSPERSRSPHTRSGENYSTPIVAVRVRVHALPDSDAYS